MPGTISSSTFVALPTHGVAHATKVARARHVASLVALAVLAASCGRSSPGALEPTTPARAFRIVYRIEQPNAATRWGELVVQRPFRVRAGLFDDRPRRGDRPEAGTLTTDDGLFQLRAEGLQEISGRQPSPGTGDQWLVSQLADAVRRKLAKRVGKATVVGRDCTDYRFAEPPVGPIAELGEGDHDDLCLTTDGLLLREVWTLKGRVIQRRTAVEVDTSGRGLDDLLDVSPATEAPPSGPVAAPTDAGASFLPDPTAPKGYSLAARDAFALRQPSEQGPVTLYTSTVWAFTRGAELVTVEAGDSSASGKVPWLDSDPSRPVTLPIGNGTTVVRNDGGEVRIDLGSNSWVRVRGTIPLADLVRYARTLRAASS
ncbi:MAG: hypothetical protein V7636_1200 [Actinomycetota bacterium]